MKSPSYTKEQLAEFLGNGGRIQRHTPQDLSSRFREGVLVAKRDLPYGHHERKHGGCQLQVHFKGGVAPEIVAAKLEYSKGLEVGKTYNFPIDCLVVSISAIERTAAKKTPYKLFGPAVPL